MGRKLVGKEGVIERTPEGVVVRCLGGSYLLEQAGVECENPQALEGERTYRKVFRNRRIFLPNELDAAQAYLSGHDVVRLADRGCGWLGEPALPVSFG